MQVLLRSLGDIVLVHQQESHLVIAFDLWELYIKIIWIA